MPAMTRLCNELVLGALRQDVVDDVAVHVGETEVASLMAIGQAFVVDSEEVETGGVKVVDVNFVFDDAKSKLIGGAVGETAFDAATCHPNAEAFFVVIATRWCFGARSGVVFLNHRGATKFTAPDHQCLVQHATLFEVLDQSRASLVDIANGPG